jgi:hypothetical protein
MTKKHYSPFWHEITNKIFTLIVVATLCISFIAFLDFASTKVQAQSYAYCGIKAGPRPLGFAGFTKGQR